MKRLVIFGILVLFLVSGVYATIYLEDTLETYSYDQEVPGGISNGPWRDEYSCNAAVVRSNTQGSGLHSGTCEEGNQCVEMHLLAGEGCPNDVCRAGRETCGYLIGYTTNGGYPYNLPITFSEGKDIYLGWWFRIDTNSGMFRGVCSTTRLQTCYDNNDCPIWEECKRESYHKGFELKRTDSFTGGGIRTAFNQGNAQIDQNYNWSRYWSVDSIGVLGGCYGQEWLNSGLCSPCPNTFGQSYASINQGICGGNLCSTNNKPLFSYNEWHRFAAHIKISNTGAGSVQEWIDNTLYFNYSNICTSSPETALPLTGGVIGIGGTLCQPRYNCPEHYELYDHIIISDNVTDLYANGFLDGPNSQSHEADTNSNGCVDQTELTNYIPRWYAGTATMQNLMSAIALWIDNIGC